MFYIFNFVFFNLNSIYYIYIFNLNYWERRDRKNKTFQKKIIFSKTLILRYPIHPSALDKSIISQLKRSVKIVFFLVAIFAGTDDFFPELLEVGHEI